MLITDDETKANIMNDYFVSVFRNDKENINIETTPPTLNNIIISEETVSNILNSLKRNKS